MRSSPVPFLLLLAAAAPAAAQVTAESIDLTLDGDSTAEPEPIYVGIDECAGSLEVDHSASLTIGGSPTGDYETRILWSIGEVTCSDDDVLECSTSAAGDCGCFAQ